jgi:hypothetical protein
MRNASIPLAVIALPVGGSPMTFPIWTAWSVCRNLPGYFLSAAYSLHAAQEIACHRFAAASVMARHKHRHRGHHCGHLTCSPCRSASPPGTSLELASPGNTSRVLREYGHVLQATPGDQWKLRTIGGIEDT